MCSYNAVNGVPSCANDYLLQTVLRGAWAFDGYVTSDCDADADVFNSHKYTATKEEAVRDVLRAGTDVDCGGFVQVGWRTLGAVYAAHVLGPTGALQTWCCECVWPWVRHIGMAYVRLGSKCSSGCKIAHCPNSAHLMLTTHTPLGTFVCVWTTNIHPSACICMHTPMYAYRLTQCMCACTGQRPERARQGCHHHGRH